MNEIKYPFLNAYVQSTPKEHDAELGADRKKPLRRSPKRSGKRKTTTKKYFDRLSSSSIIYIYITNNTMFRSILGCHRRGKTISDDELSPLNSLTICVIIHT